MEIYLLLFIFIVIVIDTESNNLNDKFIYILLTFFILFPFILLIFYIWKYCCKNNMINNDINDEILYGDENKNYQRFSINN